MDKEKQLGKVEVFVDGEFFCGIDTPMKRGKGGIVTYHQPTGYEITIRRLTRKEMEDITGDFVPDDKYIEYDTLGETNLDKGGYAA